MCLYIVDNVSTCHIIYFPYVDTEKHIHNSPSYRVPSKVLQHAVTTAVWDTYIAGWMNLDVYFHLTLFNAVATTLSLVFHAGSLDNLALNENEEFKEIVLFTASSTNVHCRKHKCTQGWIISLYTPHVSYKENLHIVKSSVTFCTRFWERKCGKLLSGCKFLKILR